MKAVTLALAIGGSCCSRVVASDGIATKKNLRRPSGGRHGVKGGDEGDLIGTEDIEFWTRMTQQVVGSLPPPLTQRPTRRVTPRPTPNPTPRPITGVIPTTPAPSPGPITPFPTTDEPTLSPVGSCGLTPQQRADQFRALALTVTDEEVLDDPSSSQAKALDWLVNDDTLGLCPSDDGPCQAVQRYIMAAFYYASGGGGWDGCNAPTEFTPAAIEEANDACEFAVTPFPVTNPRIEGSEAWLTPVDECEWGGVACWGNDDIRNGCMDQIDFENEGLVGTLIPEIGALPRLRFLILEQGDISGPIPSEYGALDRLLIFDMDFNDLTGQIPDELFDMDALQQLDLNDNSLTGSLSTKIGLLETLAFLQLDHNELSGTIPTEVGELTSLRVAFFSDNDLTGEMPAEVCANRNTTTPPGVLGTLVTDCNPQNNPEVVCSCCSSCNSLRPGP